MHCTFISNDIKKENAKSQDERKTTFYRSDTWLGVAVLGKKGDS